MENGQIRLLRAEEIECRVSIINEKGLVLLLFKDARVDQKILDETFTPMGWKRTHQFVNGSLYCTVEVWDDGKKQWIAKQDVGTMSYSEKEKGQASDSFKRACFNWGIGRELYTAPFIWIPASKVTIERRKDKLYCNEPFKVQSIGYDADRMIKELVICGKDGRILFSMRKEAKEAAPDKKADRKAHPVLSQGQMTRFEEELERTGVSLHAVLERYHIQNLEQMDDKIYRSAMAGLKKSKDKHVA